MEKTLNFAKNAKTNGPSTVLLYYSGVALDINCETVAIVPKLK